jgi:hypothetical protein
MTIFTPDPRLPYAVTSSIEFGTDQFRILRSTAKGSIASGAEEYDAPVLDITMPDFAHGSFDEVLVIAPDPETARAITDLTGRHVMSFDDFEVLVRTVATEQKADERGADELGVRNPVDVATSAYATAQRVYSLLRRQMPRVQGQVASYRSGLQPK